MSTPYHSQSDGQTKVVKQYVETYLYYLAHKQPKLWSKYLPWAVYSFNTSFCTATGYTPFEIVYSCLLPLVLPYVSGEAKVADLETQLEGDALLQLIWNNLIKAQSRMNA